MTLVALVTITLTTTVRHDYNCKGHSPRSNKTHGKFTKCHMSQIFLKTKNKYFYSFSNQILPHVSLLT